MPIVFVYGSLLRGEPNHAILEGATLLGAARTRLGIALVNAGEYPSLLFEARSRPQGGACVVGELYDVSDALLERLDAFEGHPDYFARVTVDLDDGGAAFAYALAPEVAAGLPLVPGGDWRQRGAEKKRGPKPSGA